MKRRGTHTWELYLAYCRCPSCGYIQEDRQDFVLRDSLYEKEISCLRCGAHYLIAASKKEISSQTEFDWASS